MKATARSLLVSAAYVSISSAMAQGVTVQMSPDQERQMLEQLMKKYPAVANGIVTPTTALPTTVPPTATAPAALPSGALEPTVAAVAAKPAAPAPTNRSEEELARLIAALPKPTGIGIERQRDGFMVNGSRHVDPEGNVFSYGYDVFSGDITYVVAANPETATLKYMRAMSGAAPMAIATATRGQTGWTVATVSGKSMSGENIIPTSRGFLVTHGSMASMYKPGSGITYIAVPQEFDIADFQNGDVASTDYVLLERRGAPSGHDGGANSVTNTVTNSVAKIGSLITNLGATVGINKKEDYVLFSLKTGVKYPINIANDGKPASAATNCPKYAAGGACQNMATYDALYKADGAKNTSHYFWRINWYQTPSGPILVAHENGVSDVNITDLNSGKKVNVFTRALGISSFGSWQRADGKIKVDAQLGSSAETLADAKAYLDASPTRKSGE